MLTEAQDLLGAAMLKKEAVVKAMSAEWPAWPRHCPACWRRSRIAPPRSPRASIRAAGVDVAAAKSAAAEATIVVDQGAGGL